MSFDLLGEGVPLAVQQLALALAGSITEATRDEVRRVLLAGLQAGAPVAEIARGLAPTFGPQRAATIAQTEASRGMHRGEMDYAREAGAAGLEWLASSDACPKCSALNGKRVRFGEPFATLSVGNPAYRTVYHPPLHPRCACSTKTWWAEDEPKARATR